MLHLRFFTDDKCQACTAGGEYEQYWKANKVRLSEVLLRINGGMLPEHCFDEPEKAITLHDARIRALDDGGSQVSMLLFGDHRGALREIRLQYTGVTKLIGFSNHLLADMPDCDIGCHETTVADNGEFNHLIQFAGGQLLSIQFTDLHVQLIDHPLPPRTNEEQQRWEIKTAGRIRDIEQVPERLSLLDNAGSDEIKRLAVATLGNIGDMRAEECLLQLLTTSTGLMLGDVAHSLGQLKSQQGLPHLETLLHHDVEWVRQNAKYAIRRIREEV